MERHEKNLFGHEQLPPVQIVEISIADMVLKLWAVETLLLKVEHSTPPNAWMKKPD